MTQLLHGRKRVILFYDNIIFCLYLYWSGASIFMCVERGGRRPCPRKESAFLSLVVHSSRAAANSETIILCFPEETEAKILCCLLRIKSALNRKTESGMSSSRERQLHGLKLIGSLPLHNGASIMALVEHQTRGGQRRGLFLQFLLWKRCLVAYQTARGICVDSDPSTRRRRHRPI